MPGDFSPGICRRRGRQGRQPNCRSAFVAVTLYEWSIPGIFRQRVIPQFRRALKDIAVPTKVEDPEGEVSYAIPKSLFPPSAKDRVTALLTTKANIIFDVEKKKGNSQVTSGIHVPSVLNKLPFATTVSQPEEGVKQNSSTDSNGETGNKLPVGISSRVALVDALEGLARRDEEKRLLNTYRTYIKNAQAKP